MNDFAMIKINQENDRITVSARELHEFLQVKTAFKDWFPRMCEYGFEEGVDFNPLKNEQVRLEGTRTVTRTVDDAQLTIEMAKEICMLQRNERGKAARQYFIQLEKDWNSPEKVMARALKIADEKIILLNQKNLLLEQQVAEYAPKIQYLDEILASKGTVTITQIAADYDLTAYKLNRILYEEGVQRKVGGQWLLYKEHMGKGYTKSETVTFTGRDGKEQVTMNTKWTQKGRLFIHNILTERGIIAVMDREYIA